MQSQNILALIDLKSFSVLAMVVFDYRSFEGSALDNTLWNKTGLFVSPSTTAGYGNMAPEAVTRKSIANEYFDV